MGVNQGIDLFKALQWVHKYKISIMFPLSGALRKPNFKYYLIEKLLISQSDLYPKLSKSQASPRDFSLSETGEPGP